MASGVDRAGLSATAAHAVDTEVARLRAAGAEVDGAAVEGDPRSTLLAESTGADLLVLGQRGEHGVGPVHLGSVSRHCAAHCATPTVVVPPATSTEPISRIAVGYDGSVAARAALTWALEWAGPTVAIEVVRVFETIDWLDMTATLRNFQEEITDDEAAFEADVRAHDPAGRCTSRFEVGDARATLDATAEEVDLMVLGNRGAGRLATTFLGSVASHVLHHVGTPVAVVPH